MLNGGQSRAEGRYLEEEEKANEFEKTYKAVLDALVSYNEAKAELVEKSKSSDMET